MILRLILAMFYCVIVCPPALPFCSNPRTTWLSVKAEHLHPKLFKTNLVQTNKWPERKKQKAHMKTGHKQELIVSLPHASFFFSAQTEFLCRMQFLKGPRYKISWNAPNDIYLTVYELCGNKLWCWLFFCLFQTRQGSYWNGSGVKTAILVRWYGRTWRRESPTKCLSYLSIVSFRNNIGSVRLAGCKGCSYGCGCGCAP